jgi:hypothetical protein
MSNPGSAGVPVHVVAADAAVGTNKNAAGIAGATRLTLLNSAARTIDFLTLILPVEGERSVWSGRGRKAEPIEGPEFRLRELLAVNVIAAHLAEFRNIFKAARGGRADPRSRYGARRLMSGMGRKQT